VSLAGGKHEDTLEELEYQLDYRFQDRSLLERALTHRSYAYEAGEAGRLVDHYERLEFLGDAILGFVVAEYLYRHSSSLGEGDLTRMRSHLVSAPRLAQVSRRLDLGRWMRLSRGEDRTGGRSKRALLADVFESLVAAIYLDGGLEPARRFILQHLDGELKQVCSGRYSVQDAKSALQELLHSRHLPSPGYRVLEEHGPEHRKEFLIGVFVQGRELGRGRGKSKKEAEQRAAYEALGKLASGARKEPVEQDRAGVKRSVSRDGGDEAAPAEVKPAEN